MNNRAKYWNSLYLLVTVFFIALIIAFPKLPIKFNIWGWNVDTTLEGPDINLQILGKDVNKDLEPRYGLELGGGYRIVLTANMEGVEDDKKETRLSEVENALKDRAYRVGLSDFQISSSINEDKYQINLEIGTNEDFQKVFLIATTGNLSFKQLSEENRNTTDTQVFYDPASYIDTELTKDDFDKAVVTTNPNTGEPSIQLVFTDDGLVKFGEVAKNNVGYPVAIMIDDQIISAPSISEDFLAAEISNPVISGGFEMDYAKSLATVINSGALSVPVEVETTEPIDAFWNTSVINNALIAISVGLLLATIFVFLVYKKLSVVFFLSITFNFVLSVTFIKFGFPTVLSWLFSGVMGDLIFEPIIITTSALLGLLVANLLFVRFFLILFQEFSGIKSNITEEFIDNNFKTAVSRMKYIWIMALILAVILGWFGVGFLTGFGHAIGVFCLITIFTGMSFTKVLMHLFYKAK